MQAESDTSNRFWVSLSLTLLVHLIVLVILWAQPAGITRAETADFVDVEFTEMNFALAELPTLEEQLQGKLNERVANLVSDVNASVSSDRRSTFADETEQSMAKEVEAELRAMEQAEFARLSAQEKEFELEGVPDDGQNNDINTLSEWDKRYEGEVVVSYDVQGRNHQYLPVPGYLCLTAGKVVIQVTLSSDGSVQKAMVTQSIEGDAAECMEGVALKAARRSVFDMKSQDDQWDDYVPFCCSTLAVEN